MRALPLLFSSALLFSGTVAAPQSVPAQTDSSAALVPLARALGATPTSASVEVYATEIVTIAPPVQSLEHALLPSARWQESALGSGTVLRGVRGGLTARISALPLPHGRVFLSCSRSEDVPPAKIASALEELWGTPCGTDEASVVLTARLGVRPDAAQIRQAIRLVGAKPLGVLAGPTGAFALAELPGGAPQVTVGGRSMNLALRISYDRAPTANVLIGAPTLRPSR
ncbi:MAG: hypothetical protein M0Z66_02505 [Thermaerobacter sp.]|nr:hypothetical protein [Thermaerobacter sp.]